MPNFYIHLQAAAETMERLKAALPAGSPLTRQEADDLFNVAHTHRNYFAAGAYGPDLFVLLPDFLGDTGKCLQKIIEFVMTTWKAFDEEFYSHWEEWMTPVLDEANTLANGITGGMLGEVSLALDTFGGAVTNFELGLATRMKDILGLLTAATQTGYSENTFYWSDMFHSRRTFRFARALYSNAMQADSDKAPGQRAFALGWISHCATDVAGHPFVNAKCGGPYRTHWTRHHLIENHMDASVYQQKHAQDTCYDSLAASALHFSMAFRPGDRPWDDYDYFPSSERRPDYPPGDSADESARRKQVFDVGTEPLPEHICELLLKTMQDVYTGRDDRDGPRILCWDEGMHTGGRPTVKMLQNMYQLAFEYVKFSTSSGLSPRPPRSPDVITDHDLPRPPGSPNDSAGADPADSKELNLLDILLAVLAYAIWLAEVAVWVVTVLPGLLADLATWPLRELLHQLLVVPAWDLYMSTRLPLVMEGFLTPLPGEISRGLVELGNDETEALKQLRDDLNDQMGFAPPGQDRNAKEPSGLGADRGASTKGFGLDPAYPRAMVTDSDPPASAAALPDADIVPSEFVAPWRYPRHNTAGMRVGWEAPRTHVGPYLQGQDAGVLLGGMPGSDTARSKFEQAATPAETENLSASLMPSGAHLGDAVDYGVYVIGRLTGHDASNPLPDFNLEADRGYAYHCWDYLRHTPGTPPSPRNDHDSDFPDQWRCMPQIPTFLAGGQTAEQIRQQHKRIYERHGYQEPYTVPERYDPADNPHHRSAYDPLKRIAHAYIGKDWLPPGGCDDIDLQVSAQEMKDAGMSPTGRTVKS
jgi:hypothetical protein